MFSQPYEWYDRGLPNNREAFRLLADITGFRGFDRPAFGRWTATDFESRLRQYGPYAFFGFWNGYPHVIVVTGLIEVDGQQAVVTIDPVRGFATSQSISQFNGLMNERMQTFNFNRLNPLYLPNSQPVRDVVLQH
jgi:hypothetical protein